MMSLEEALKLEKDKTLEVAYKSVRQALRLGTAKFISDVSGGNLEKYIDSFAGDELDEKTGRRILQRAEERNRILDDLLTVGMLMESVFAPLGDLSGGRLALKLSSTSMINIERLIIYTKELKINTFSHHKERYSYGASEDQEAKTLIPKQAIRTIKIFIDKYYYTFRAVSINPSAKVVFNKIAIFREKLLTFEWHIYELQRKLEKDFQRDFGAFSRELKLAMLYLKKLIEALDASNFGKLVNTLYEQERETGLRKFIKHNEVITIKHKESTSTVRIKFIMEQFDIAMAPIRRQLNAVALTTSNGKLLKSADTQKAFWEISDKIVLFRETMALVIAEFGKGVSVLDEDYKFFTHTIQSTIIPYVSQSVGELNDTFIIGMKNADKFFWKVMQKAIEQSLNNLITIDEILGLSIRVTRADFEHRLSEQELDQDMIVDTAIVTVETDPN